ncbi:hypothetical protein HOY82DRAFT_599442 [Tuber indicum]|nr:hypothetical protein HOY82DRAFT_599442 [Tuber indicum]
MPALSQPAIEAILSQVGKRDCGGDKEGEDGNGQGPVAIVGLIVAALTLLVAIVSLQSSRLRRWGARLLSLQLNQNITQEVPGVAPPNRAQEAPVTAHPNPTEEAPGISPPNLPLEAPGIVHPNRAQEAPDIAPPNLASTTLTASEEPRAIRVMQTPISGPIFIYNPHTHIPPADIQTLSRPVMVASPEMTEPLQAGITRTKKTQAGSREVVAMKMVILAGY